MNDLYICNIDGVNCGFYVLKKFIFFIYFIYKIRIVFNGRLRFVGNINGKLVDKIVNIIFVVEFGCK